MIDSKIEDYSEKHSSDHSNILNELYRETNLKMVHPRMISGKQQGRFLSMLSHMIRPKTILEIGTYTGYSAICLSEGLAENGKIHTIELDPELESIASKYFKKAAVENQIIQYFGNALKIIPELDLLFDLVFIDADKNNYSNYYNLVFDKIRSGGFLLADNVLWSGKVIEPIKKGDKDTPGIIEFNTLVQQDDRVENVLLPLRDGLMLIRKK
ncbi:MAG: class I SAM-dependent methyltransferase [Bacteroidales bacterium]|nr:class I SAM-dependent methyltransferase [Bacteroidales bacterium]RLD39527.1 MAG: methyltransferase [Bacteroidota bacterium]